MKNETRKHYGAYLTQLASINGVASAAEKFTVAPSVQQKLAGGGQGSVMKPSFWMPARCAVAMACATRS